MFFLIPKVQSSQVVTVSDGGFVVLQVVKDASGEYQRFFFFLIIIFIFIFASFALYT